MPSFLKQSRIINHTHIVGNQERSSSKLAQSPRKTYERNDRSGSTTARKPNQAKIIIDVVLRNKVNTTPMV